MEQKLTLIDQRMSQPADFDDGGGDDDDDEAAWMRIENFAKDFHGNWIQQVKRMTHLLPWMSC